MWTAKKGILIEDNNPAIIKVKVAYSNGNPDSDFTDGPYRVSSLEDLDRIIASQLEALNTADVIKANYVAGDFVPPTPPTPTPISADQQAEIDLNKALQAARLAKEIAELKLSTDPDVQAAVADITKAQTSLTSSVVAEPMTIAPIAP